MYLYPCVLHMKKEMKVNNLVIKSQNINENCTYLYDNVLMIIVIECYTEFYKRYKIAAIYCLTIFNFNRKTITYFYCFANIKRSASNNIHKRSYTIL